MKRPLTQLSPKFSMCSSCSLSRLFLFGTSALLLSGTATVESKGAEGIPIGTHRQMFIDAYLIAEMENITRRLRPVEKYPGNPVVRPDRPWERDLAVPQGSVIYDQEDGIYKMWYTTNVQSIGEGVTFNKGKALAYAVSEDGIRWDKPEMDLVLEDGQKTNQLIGPMKFGYMYQPYFVIKDDREENPDRLYKMAFLSIQRNVSEYESPHHPGTRRGLGIAFSPDGLHWTKVRDFASDDIIDISHFMIEPESDKPYVIYGRTLYVSPEIESAWKDYDWFERVYNGRSVIRTRSADFLNWEPAEFVMGADLTDPPSTMIYSMNVFPYEGVYLGLSQRYISKLDTSTIDIQLAISRDGVHFERPFREPFFPLGGVGTWDRFILHNMSGPPLVHGNELRFYYGGRTSRHAPNKMPDTKYGGATGLATLQKDRFVSVEASFDGGSLTTKPLLFEGSKFHVNCNTAFGKMEVELADASGNPIAGYRAIVEGIDSVDHVVAFDAPLPNLASHPVEIKFTLYNAQLYSFFVQ